MVTTTAGSPLRLVLLFGGRSAEHDVSCISAASVLKAVDFDRYRVEPVGLTRDGRWVLAEAARTTLARGGAEALPESLTAEGTEVTPFDVLRTGEPLVVFPLLHGPYGEDGTVQGLCELAGVPYVGSGVLGSAVCMDKLVAKDLLAAAGLPQVRHMAVRDGDVERSFAETVGRRLGWPVFVKPANLGSSIGVTRVAEQSGLEAALQTALGYDEWAVVEEGVDGREIECGVLGDRSPEASVPGEIRPSRDFYDYTDKYLDGAAELLVPADLPMGVAEEVRELAVAAFLALRAEGMARVDLFYEDPGRGLLVNEVNTIPGFTPISMYPRLWAGTGVPYPQLIDRLVQLAQERHRRRIGRGAAPA